MKTTRHNIGVEIFLNNLDYLRPMFVITSITPGAPELAGSITSVCHCAGLHIQEITGSAGHTVKSVEELGFTDSADMYHDAPFDKGNRVTLVNADGLTAGVWIDGCSVRRMREFFPQHPADTLCWAIEVRVPERRRR